MHGIPRNFGGGAVCRAGATALDKNHRNHDISRWGTSNGPKCALLSHSAYLIVFNFPWVYYHSKSLCVSYRNMFALRVRASGFLLRQRTPPNSLMLRRMTSDIVNNHKHEWIAIIPDCEGMLEDRMRVRQ